MGKIIIVLLALFLLVSLYAVYLALNKKRQLDKWEILKEGMGEQELIKVMGDGYSVDYKGNDVNVYTWAANAPDNYQGVKVVKVTCSGGKVTDIHTSKH